LLLKNPCRNILGREREKKNAEKCSEALGKWNYQNKRENEKQ